MAGVAGVVKLDEVALREEFWTIGPGEVVIDVGCGHGTYTLPALAAGATVYAVDADSNNIRNLREVAGDVLGLVPIHLALYDGRQYPPRLRDQIKATAWHAMAPTHCEWSTLDEVAKDLDRLDWVKIDVEGGELGVLHGGQKILRKFHPRLFIEDHSLVYSWARQMGSTKHITRLLTELGYDVQVVPYVGSGPARNYFVCV